MDTMKKAGIIGGALIGGVIGGAVSVVGKVAGVKLIDDIGTSIVDSTILTGTIAGDIASGTADVVAGKVKKDDEQIEDGKEDLKSGGGKVVGNIVNNFHLTVDNAGEIVRGIKRRDLKRTVEGTKTFVKMAAVGAITVGAIKLSDSADRGAGQDPAAGGNASAGAKGNASAGAAAASEKMTAGAAASKVGGAGAATRAAENIEKR